MLRTRVFVVDDHPFFRSGVVSWLNQQQNLICCGDAESIAAAAKAIPEARPEVLLLDLNLKDGDGLTFCAELLLQSPQLRILILSQAAEDAFAHRALRAGARGYIMKSEATESVLEAIETVQRGEIYVSRTMGARLLHNLFPDRASSIPSLVRLSDRELQVFQLMGSGCRNPEIAAILKLSPKTVDTYRENLKQKLGFPTADALLQCARQWVEKKEFVPGNL
jgi:DNA-binding NarL/FixJ family response regulator